jgi:hypothetical protein
MDTPERAAELVSIIECNAGEPDAIVRALAPVYRQAEAAKDECREILWYMIKAAFNVSSAHSLALDEYLAAIEQGREPSEEARARFASQQHTAKSEAQMVYGSSILVADSNSSSLFKIDFGDTGQNKGPIEFRILDERGATVHSIVTRAKGSNSGAEETEQE